MDYNEHQTEATHYFDDLEVGTHRKLGIRTVTKEEIIAFAERFDPHAMHLDEGRATNSPFGGLIASGWHTASLTMRLFVDGLLDEISVIGGIGVDDLQWFKPVEPADTLRAEATIVEKEPWDDTRGQVRFRVQTYNQRDEEVMARTDRILVAREDT